MKTLRLFFALAAVAALAACGSDPVTAPGPDLKPNHGVMSEPSVEPGEPTPCTSTSPSTTTATSTTTCAVMGSGH